MLDAGPREIHSFRICENDAGLNILNFSPQADFLDSVLCIHNLFVTTIFMLGYKNILWTQPGADMSHESVSAKSLVTVYGQQFGNASFSGINPNR